MGVTHWCVGDVGFLYPSGDYTQAAKITADLLTDTEKRKAVGAAARAEVERWGWMAATQHLREQQYPQAIRRNRGRRWWVLYWSLLMHTHVPPVLGTVLCAHLMT